MKSRGNNINTATLNTPNLFMFVMLLLELLEGPGTYFSASAH
jgi:hypothetical protein